MQGGVRDTGQNGQQMCEKRQVRFLVRRAVCQCQGKIHHEGYRDKSASEWQDGLRKGIDSLLLFIKNGFEMKPLPFLPALPHLTPPKSSIPRCIFCVPVVGYCLF